jgi:hypothetical protein
LRSGSPSAGGAARFHRHASEIACDYANDAFAPASRGSAPIGLVLRYRDIPDQEQIAYVDGPFRVWYIVEAGRARLNDFVR